MIGVLMSEKKEKQDKRPIEMTTDEAIDYVFGSEIADKLRDEAGKNDLEEPEPES
jgi:hypothetical protein